MKRRQRKHGLELIETDQARHVWSELPMGKTIPVWVVIFPTNVRVVARHDGTTLARAYPAEMVGVYDMTIALRDFMADVRFAGRELIKRVQKRAA